MTNAFLLHLLKALPETTETHTREDKHSPSWLSFITEPQNFHPDSVLHRTNPYVFMKKGQIHFPKVFMVSILY